MTRLVMVLPEAWRDIDDENDRALIRAELVRWTEQSLPDGFVRHIGGETVFRYPVGAGYVASCLMVEVPVAHVVVMRFLPHF